MARAKGVVLDVKDAKILLDGVVTASCEVVTSCVDLSNVFLSRANVAEGSSSASSL